MGHLYEVQTNSGPCIVSMNGRHHNSGKTGFRKHLIQAILNAAAHVTGGVILSQYIYSGSR